MRPYGIGAQACVGSTEYADICGYISSGNSVIEQDVVHRDVGQRVCARAADVLPGRATVGGAKDVAERVPETGERRIRGVRHIRVMRIHSDGRDRASRRPGRVGQVGPVPSVMERQIQMNWQVVYTVLGTLGSIAA